MRSEKRDECGSIGDRSRWEHKGNTAVEPDSRHGWPTHTMLDESPSVLRRAQRRGSTNPVRVDVHDVPVEHAGRSEILDALFNVAHCPAIEEGHGGRSDGRAGERSRHQVATEKGKKEECARPKERRPVHGPIGQSPSPAVGEQAERLDILLRKYVRELHRPPNDRELCRRRGGTPIGR